MLIISSFSILMFVRIVCIALIDCWHCKYATYYGPPSDFLYYNLTSCLPCHREDNYYPSLEDALDIIVDWTLRMVTCTWEWLLLPENGYLYLRMVTCTWEWLLVPDNGYLYLRMVTCTWEWLLVNENGYLYLRMVTCT
jgi:hypothetical protein